MKILMAVLSISIIAVAPFVGEVPLDLVQIFENNSASRMLFFDIRLPRVIVAFFSGAILALGGLVFQAVFRNPLTTPFTLGIASGATVGAAVAILFLPMSFFVLSYLFSFLGAFFTILILFFISRYLRSGNTNSLLLVGIALSFFYSALLMVAYYVSDFSQSYSIMRFTMGSLNVVGMQSVYLVIVAAVVLLSVVWHYKGEFKLLLTSYDNAFIKGIAVKRLNLILLFSVSISVGICVSVVGPIGFVGLVIPHIMKMLYKQSSDRLIVPVFFYGGVFLVVCDLLARNLSTASDLPIGVVTSFIGGPFFIYIIIKRKQNG
ncbi:MAG: FecCD family ABC transporter permease [Campylobacterota bacterium]